MKSELLERYSRNIMLREIGGQGQKRLLKARVLVIGVGGLGNSALMYLTTSGVGTIGIIDYDAISLSNLQRQVLFGVEDIGKLKVDVAKLSLNSLNFPKSLITSCPPLPSFGIARISNALLRSTLNISSSFFKDLFSE